MIFSPSGEQPKWHLFPYYIMTNNCRFYSNISWILLLHKTWGNYNKFNFTKSLRVYYWHVKMPQCGYMEHGLKDIKCSVQKHIAPWAICYNSPLVCDQPLLWDSSLGQPEWNVCSLMSYSKCLLFCSKAATVVFGTQGKASRTWNISSLHTNMDLFT